jgi:hypothetical protein
VLDLGMASSMVKEWEGEDLSQDGGVWYSVLGFCILTLLHFPIYRVYVS